AAGEPMEPIVGEIVPAPRGPVVTALLGVSGLLLALHLARLFGRIAFAYKKPAQITLLESEAGGVRVRWRVEVLKRTLFDRDLVRVTREVRYPRIALYAGLLSLAIGSYIGVSAFVDGVRVASPSLIVSGIVIVATGLALDFGLSSLAPAARGLCRVLFVPRDG